MTVWDNVAYGPRSLKKDKAEVKRRVDELLEIVRLTDFAQRKPAQLSGGQQQRVALARALVNYPSALLLDEPLGALDLKLRQVMQFELKRIQREVGITFVYVTHDQEEALTMSDRIAVMNAGNVDQIGTPTEIYDRPSTVFVASFIGQANLWAGPTDRSGQPRLRPGRGSRHHAEGQARRHHHRTRRPSHPDDPAGTRSGVDGRADRRCRHRARDGHRPHLPGPRRAAVARRTRRLDRSWRISDPSRICRCCVRAIRSTSAGHPRPRWCFRPPTSPPPRTSRRCSTTRDGPSVHPVPFSPESTKGTVAMPNEIDPRLLARLATNRTSVAASSAAAPPPRRRRPRPVLPGRLWFGQAASRRRRRRGGSPPAARCGSPTGRLHGRRFRHGVPDSDRASRSTTKRTSTTTRSGSPRSRSRCRASRTSAQTLPCRPRSWPSACSSWACSAR